MENTQNGRQTPVSPPAGGSNHNCSMPGKRLMHQIMLLPSSCVFSSTSLPSTPPVCIRQKENQVISLEIRGRKTLQVVYLYAGISSNVLSWLVFISVSKSSPNLLGVSLHCHLSLLVRVPL